MPHYAKVSGQLLNRVGHSGGHCLFPNLKESFQDYTTEYIVWCKGFCLLVLG